MPESTKAEKPVENEQGHRLDTEARDTGTIPTEDEQIEELKKWLGDSPVFSNCRGKLGSWSGINAFLETNQEGAPTHPTWNSVEKTIRDRRAMENVMLHKLSTLRTQGWLHACKALTRALIDPGYILPGELTPLDRRKPGVLVMFEPKNTIPLLRWMSLLDYGTIVSHAEADVSNRNKDWRPDLKSWSQGMLKSNPDFADYVSTDKGQHIQPLAPKSVLSSSKWTERLSDAFWFGSLYIGDPDRQDYDFLSNYRFAYFIEDKTQQDILELFTREEQNDVATWQFYYPAHVHPSCCYGLKIGLLPESLFDPFQKRYPSYSSVGASHGLKALMIPDHDMRHPIFDYSTNRQNPQARPEDIGMSLNIQVR